MTAGAADGKLDFQPKSRSSSAEVRRPAWPHRCERTRAGLAAAAANGRKGGRPRKVDDADAAKARQLREKGITATDIAKMLGVSRATVYRYLSDGVPLSA
jgi:hypothetical protein